MILWLAIRGAVLGAAITLLIIGAVLWLIGSILRIQSWSRLQTFFGNNMTLFSAHFTNEAFKGSKLAKIGAILDITIFLSFIGDILRIFGYFKLSTLRDLTESGPVPVQTAYAPQPVRAEPPKQVIAMFCPNCGGKLKGGERYCSTCGSEIQI